MSRQTAAMHLESAPRSFAKAGDRTSAVLDAMCEQAEQLRPKDAVWLAQRLLVHVEANGIDYGDFQSAQAVERYVRKAINALNGLSLS
jgi:hypothetical protein